MALNIAIDGPVGAGKSTVAAQVARALHILHLDTGAMYRALALAAVRAGVDMKDAAAVEALCARVRIGVRQEADGQHTYVDAEDVTALLRTQDIAAHASAISQHGAVRHYMTALQRAYAADTDMVLDGRDIGSFVLPNARFKFFLTGTPEARAARRHLELQAKGAPDTYEEVLSQLRARDLQDSTRDVAPLRQAEDALLVDTTARTQAQVVALILDIVRGGMDA